MSEHGGPWRVKTISLTKNEKFLCHGRGCHTIYEPREVIDPANDDYALYVQ